MLLLSSIAFAGSLVHPPDIDGARLVTYRGSGTTIGAIADSLDQNSPYRDPAGQRWHGGTKYQLRWSWHSVGGGRCAVDPLVAKVTVVLPTVRTRPGLQGRVGDYLDALAEHEQGHVDRARAEIRELRQRLDAMGPAPCSRLGAAVEAAGQATLDRLDHRMETYDARTGHGASQDARLR